MLKNFLDEVIAQLAKIISAKGKQAQRPQSGKGAVDFEEVAGVKEFLRKSSVKLFVAALFTAGIPFVGITLAALTGLAIILLFLLEHWYE